MDSNDPDGAAVRFPPPLVYLAAVLAGALLHAFVLPFPVRPALSMRIILSLAPALLGLAMMASAVGLFKQTGQDPKPWKATPQIISTGVYGFTRNPMYVSMALLQTSVGVGLANGWVIALVPLVLVVIYGIAIRHEEAYLERKFGDTYVEYKKAVRHWF